MTQVKFNGKTYTLKESAEYDQSSNQYLASATGENGKDYIVHWNIKADIDSDTAEEDEMCDWDEPSEVEEDTLMCWGEPSEENMKIVKTTETPIGNMELIEAAKLAIQEYMATPKAKRAETTVSVMDGCMPLFKVSADMRLSDITFMFDNDNYIEETDGGYTLYTGASSETVETEYDALWLWLQYINGEWE